MLYGMRRHKSTCGGRSVILVYSVLKKEKITQLNIIFHFFWAVTPIRATIKVNGKPQILSTRSLQTPELIDLKFDLDDYVGSVTLHAKNGTNRPRGPMGQRGEI